MKTVRVYFEDYISANPTIPSFSINVFAPKDDTEETYTLIGTGGGPVTITKRYKSGDYWMLTGYAELQGMNDSFAYDYVLFSYDGSLVYPEKLLGVPYAYMPLGSDGIYDVQPAFINWKLSEVE